MERRTGSLSGFGLTDILSTILRIGLEVFWETAGNSHAAIASRDIVPNDA